MTKRQQIVAIALVSAAILCAVWGPLIWEIIRNG